MTYLGFRRLKNPHTSRLTELSIKSFSRNKKSEDDHQFRCQDMKIVPGTNDSLQVRRYDYQDLKVILDNKDHLLNEPEIFARSIPMLREISESFRFTFTSFVDLTALGDLLPDQSIQVLQENVTRPLQLRMRSSTYTIGYEWPATEPGSNSSCSQYKYTEERTAKRPRGTRNAIKLQDKMEIIKYWEENQSKSIVQISQHFCLPRTTIHGVIKKRHAIMDASMHQPQASLTPDGCRIVETRFRILEELLSSWFFKLKITGIAVSNKKITAQAFEVHRMLSGLLREPLPPCLFTSGWLKGFKKRRGIGPVAMKEECESGNTTSQSNFQTYAEEDIYICDMTSMFLGLMPVNVFRTSESKFSRGPDRYSASVLLCCNATGQDKLDPLVFVRQSEGVFETEGYSDIMLDPSADDASKTSIENWLNNFDAMNGKERKILLFVDTTLWELLAIGFEKSLHQWSNKILLHKLQEPRNGIPSIGARIMKEFKANYHTLLVEKWARNKPRNAECMVDTEPHLKLIPKAWQSVHQETIKSCFRRLYSSSSPSHAGHQVNAVQSVRTHVETKLSQVLKSAFPTVPDTVLQYYLIQDKDTGPSSFLRTQISELQKNCNFEMFFGTRCMRPR